MPHRDPQTGQFTSGPAADYDEFETLVVSDELTIPASDLGGSSAETWGEGSNFSYEVADLDEVLDRDEIGRLVHAYARIEAIVKSTSTADGMVLAQVEFSTRDTAHVSEGSNSGATNDESGSGGDFAINSNEPDSASAFDLIVPRPLTALGGNGITDGTNGVGGVASAADDSVEYHPGLAGPSFDVRDAVHVSGNIQVQNTSDASPSVMWTLGMVLAPEEFR